MLSLKTEDVCEKYACKRTWVFVWKRVNIDLWLSWYCTEKLRSTGYIPAWLHSSFPSRFVLFKGQRWMWYCSLCDCGGTTLQASFYLNWFLTLTSDQLVENTHYSYSNMTQREGEKKVRKTKCVVMWLFNNVQFWWHEILFLYIFRTNSFLTGCITRLCCIKVM